MDVYDWVRSGYVGNSLMFSHCAVIAAIAAVVGPIVSVRISHRMMENENIRRDSAAVFSNLTKNLSAYHQATSTFLVAKNDWVRAGEAKNKFHEDVRNEAKDQAELDEILQSPRFISLSDWHKAEFSAGRRDFDITMYRVNEVMSQLYADQIAVKFIYGREADDFILKMKKLKASAKDLPEVEGTDAEEKILEDILIAIDEVIDEVTKLYNTTMEKKKRD